MKTQLSDAEILALFEQLGIASDQERQSLLRALGYRSAEVEPEMVRFDIGFNAALPDR